MNKIEELSLNHQIVWNSIKQLKDGERITIPQLIALTNLSKRRLYSVIRDLRRAGFLIGGSKHKATTGYFLITDEETLEMATYSLNQAAYDLLKTARLMEKTYYEEKYGSLLDAEEVEGK